MKINIPGKFIVMHEHEGVPILETLTQRLGIFIFY